LKSANLTKTNRGKSMVVLHLIWEAVHAPMALWVISCVKISCYLSEIIQKMKYSECIESPKHILWENCLEIGLYHEYSVDR
jgi:hypothetical protein